VRKHDFSLERAAFLTVLHRLFCGGSDRAADRWREDYCEFRRNPAGDSETKSATIPI
jgi:hypothetical protein